MLEPHDEVVGTATLDDLLAIPEEDRWHELVGGVILPRGAATALHGGVKCCLAAALEPFDRKPGKTKPGGWWCAISVDVFFDAANTLCPDLVGWRRDRVPEQPKDIVVRTRPDWVCEILSTHRSTDLVKKKRVYHRYGVPHCWIVDPDASMITVYRWSPDGYVDILSAERGERVRAEPFEAIEMSVGVLLGDDEEDE